jgi:hypothetical protein
MSGQVNHPVLPEREVAQDRQPGRVGEAPEQAYRCGGADLSGHVSSRSQFQTSNIHRHGSMTSLKCVHVK